MRASFSSHSQRKRTRKTPAVASSPPRVVVPLVVQECLPPMVSPMVKGTFTDGMTQTPPPTSRVIRSLSVPCNLPVAAESFIMKVMEQQTMQEEEKEERLSDAESVDSRTTEDKSASATRTSADSTENNAFLPLKRLDSQEFFLPFDEDGVIPEEELHHEVAAGNVAIERTTTASPLQQQQLLQQPLCGRDVAVARLEEFFLGGPLLSTPPQYMDTFPHYGYSPVSTTEIDRAMSADKLQSNGKFCSAISTSSLLSDGLQEDDSLTLDGMDVGRTCGQTGEAKHVSHSGNQHRAVNKLSLKDRTISLPIELTPISNPPVTARRRSSLKKVSSNGQFPPMKPSSSNNSLKRNVSFGSAKIREFNVAISDNPCCSYGPPIGLSWEYQEREEVPLETYEASREGNRRQGHSLLLSFYERHFMLIKQGGYSKTEIKETMKEVERVKRERMVTDLFLPASPLDETMEHVMDTVKKYFHRPQRKDLPNTKRSESV
ncbi:hypothetical protein IV203_036655 [Nitzschia inconspicua]|uniref:Uncharacterized protein n=1 Tax=Nitzschia inconspicua TaxID=303405 RepID=A0A9K3LH30_9STRA|nr:hypothetical protein IV203_036655 [Nitzschia inconspicua]